MQRLLENNLLSFVQSVIRVEKLKSTNNQVDGLIIGTGEEDFTKGSTHYTLHIDDKVFQLVDVPGIEGNESCYIQQVKDAIAEAHMVVYVNGTNKKPEMGTAEKIKSYLEYGTKVYPLINVRGFADAYEFEEDQQSLIEQGAAGEALKQTVGVLAPVLGADVLLPGNCVHGLLAFSTLAYDDATQSTTIHPSRHHNLLVQQKGYFKNFSTHKKMLEFSQINAIACVIKNKVSTFQEDIVESNKGKLCETLSAYLQVLEEQLISHQAFLKKVEPTFKNCRKTFEDAIAIFKGRIIDAHRNCCNTFLTSLTEESDRIIEDNFGDSKKIIQEIESKFNSLQEDIEKEVRKGTEDNLKNLKEQLLEAVSRLLENIKQIEFQQHISFNGNFRFNFASDSKFGYNLELSDFASMAFKVFNYARSGASAGKVFPMGALIGAITGALVGIMMSVVGLFSSKASKIRKAQKGVNKEIKEASDNAVSRVSGEIEKLVDAIRKELEDGLLKRVENMQKELNRPIPILEEQITQINKLKDQLERMTYGTIQTI